MKKNLNPSFLGKFQKLKPLPLKGEGLQLWTNLYIIQKMAEVENI